MEKSTAEMEKSTAEMEKSTAEIAQDLRQKVLPKLFA